MGYNDESAARLVFDLETVPLPEAADYLEPVEAPANYKDPVKIAAYIAEKQAEQIARAGLDVDLCRVVAMGWWEEGQDQIDVDVVKGGDVDEGTLIQAFWFRAQQRHLVGFNCLGFDLPVLLRRSLYLGIPAPNLQIDRFKHPQVTDLLDVLSYSGKLRLRGLSFYAKRLGIDVPDDLTGADIGAAVQAGEWGKVEAHCRADVQKTAHLAARLGYFRPLAVTA